MCTFARNYASLTLVAFTLLTQTGTAHAVKPDSLTTQTWGNLQSLPAGTSIDIKALKRHAACKLKAVDADTLTCTRGADLVFQRAEIQSVVRPRRGRSTLIALGIGAGTGAGIGAATSGCTAQQRNSFLGCFLTPTRPEGAAFGAVLFGAIATPIGYFTDFAKTTVYKAP